MTHGRKIALELGEQLVVLAKYLIVQKVPHDVEDRAVQDDHALLDRLIADGADGEEEDGGIEQGDEDRGLFIAVGEFFIWFYFNLFLRYLQIYTHTHTHAHTRRTKFTSRKNYISSRIR